MTLKPAPYRPRWCAPSQARAHCEALYRSKDVTWTLFRAVLDGAVSARLDGAILTPHEREQVVFSAERHREGENFVALPDAMEVSLSELEHVLATSAARIERETAPAAENVRHAQIRDAAQRIGAPMLGAKERNKRIRAEVGAAVSDRTIARALRGTGLLHAARRRKDRP